MGIRRHSPPPGFDSNGLWPVDPDGLAIEIRVGPKTSPDGKARPAISHSWMRASRTSEP